MEKFKIGIIGNGSRSHTLTMKIVNSEVVEMTIHPKYEVTRLDILCASLVTNGYVDSRCHPEPVHRISRLVRVNHKFNAYENPMWGARVIRNTCVCSNKKVNRKLRGEFYDWDNDNT